MSSSNHRIKLESHSRFSLTGHMISHWVVADSIKPSCRKARKCPAAFSTTVSQQSLTQRPLTMGQHSSVIAALGFARRLSRIMFQIWHQSSVILWGGCGSGGRSVTHQPEGGSVCGSTSRHGKVSMGKILNPTLPPMCVIGAWMCVGVVES